MKIPRSQNQPGFIALMSVIIIFAVLLVLAAGIAAGASFSRLNTADAGYKLRSRALAEACADKARLLLAQNPQFSSASAVPVGSDNCAIVSVSGSGGFYTIKTQGVYPGSASGAYTDLTVVAKASDLSIVSWSERAN